MGQQQPAIESKKFGRYLRRIREDRKLSLDTVEEMTLGYPEPVTKSHLSRIENGQAVPTFPRMYALSQVYGVPIASLAERFETQLRRQMGPGFGEDLSYSEILERCSRLIETGRYADALQGYDALLEFYGDGGEATGPEQIELRLRRVTCLVHLTRYSAAKDDIEELLGEKDLDLRHRALALHYFTMCAQRMGRLMVASMGMEQAERAVRELGDAKLEAHLAALKGSLMFAMQRYDDSARAYVDALKAFRDDGNGFEACRIRINLAETLLLRSQPNEARKHLVAAIGEAEKQGYDRQLAQALGAMGLIAHRRGDQDAAESYFLQSNNLARQREYYAVVFRNCYYLWQIARSRGDAATARANERTLRSFLSRVDETMVEARDYLAHLAGGQS